MIPTINLTNFVISRTVLYDSARNGNKFTYCLTRRLKFTYNTTCFSICFLNLSVYLNLCIIASQVGDQVVALPEYKAWAELVAVPAQYVYALPEGMSALDAVAITTNYVVAYLLLFEMANLTPNKSLLLHSAGGGVVNIFFSFEVF